MSEVTSTITDGVGIQTFISKEKIIHSMNHQKFLLKQRKSLTKTQVQENITKIVELIAVLLVAGCLVLVCIFGLF